MELALNYVWLLAAATLLGLWWKQKRVTTRFWIGELLAIGALLIVLFPVVSVSDDLLVATNITESDNSIRRDLDGVHPHSTIPPSLLFLSLPVNTEEAMRTVEILHPPAAWVLSAPGLLSEQANRPPPTV